MKKYVLMVLFMMGALAVSAEMRTWTLWGGSQTVEGEFVEVKTDKKTGELTVKVNLKEGGSRGLSLRGLSADDKAYVESKTKKAEAE